MRVLLFQAILLITLIPNIFVIDWLQFILGILPLTFLVPFALAQERQVIYYNGYSDMDYTEIDNMTFMSQVDGTIKEVSISLTVRTAFTLSGWYNYRMQSYDTLHGVEGNDLGYLDVWHDSTVESATGHTTSAQQMPNILPFNASQDSLSYSRERLSYYTKKGVEWNWDARFTQPKSTTFAAGVAVITIEIMQVVSPYRVGSIMFSTSAMKVGILFSSGTGESDSGHFNIAMPSAGYMTNARIHGYNLVSGDAPLDIIISPDMDIRRENDEDWVSETFVTGSVGTNAFQVTLSRMEREDETSVPNIYAHWGNKRVTMLKRSTLVVAYQSQAAMSNTIFFFTADFIPFEGASFRQKWTDVNLTESRDYASIYAFPVDLKDCKVTLISSLTVGAGVMDIRLMSHNTPFDDMGILDDIQNTGGSVLDVNSIDVEGVTNYQNSIALIPLSATRGAETNMIHVGDVYQDDRIGFDWEIQAAITGVVHFLISGKIGKKYYSKGGKWLMGTGTQDISEFI